MVSNDPALSHYKNGTLLKQICKCKGSMKYVHGGCIIKWLNTKNSRHCDLCLQEFDISYEFSSIGEILSRAYQYAFNDKRRLLRGMLYALYLWIFSRRFLNMIYSILKYIRNFIYTSFSHIKSPESLKKLLSFVTYKPEIKPVSPKTKALLDSTRFMSVF